MNSTSLLPSSLILSSAWSRLLLNPSIEIFSSFTVFSSSISVNFSSFLSLPWKFYFMHCFPDLSENLNDHYFEVLSGTSLIFFSLRTFLRFYLVLFFLDHISVSSFFFSLCVGLCTLEKTATSSSLDSSVVWKMGLIFQPSPRPWLSLKSLWWSNLFPSFLVVPSSWGCTEIHFDVGIFLFT